MNTIKELLDATKAAKGVTSDYALAKALSISTQRISDYYKSSRVPDEFACLQIAEALERPLDEILAAVRIEAEKDENRREVWRRYYKSIGGIAASIMTVFFLVCTLIVTSTPAEASNSKASKAEHFVLCKISARIRKAALIVWNTLTTSVQRFCFSG